MWFKECLGVATALGVLFGSTARASSPCLDDKEERATATGILTIGQAQDAAGRPERPYILTLKAPVCLTTDDPSEKVDASMTIHIFATDAKMTARIAKMVGKSVHVRGRPFPAMTAHHHAPIVMNVVEIAPR